MSIRILLAAFCLLSLSPLARAAEEVPPAEQNPTMTLRILAEDEKTIGDSDRKLQQAAKVKSDQQQFDAVLSSLNRILGTGSTIVTLLICGAAVGALVAILISRRRTRHWLKRAREVR